MQSIDLYFNVTKRNEGKKAKQSIENWKNLPLVLNGEGLKL